MWLFTRHGFFSVVANHSADRIVIRARRREHLESLLDRLDMQRHIVQLPDADYRFRFTVPKLEWVEIAAQLADDIDYDNFKSEAHRVLGFDDYTRALHEVWALVDDRLNDTRRSAFNEEGMMGESTAANRPPPPRRGKHRAKGGLHNKKRKAKHG